MGDIERQLLALATALVELTTALLNPLFERCGTQTAYSIPLTFNNRPVLKCGHSISTLRIPPIPGRAHFTVMAPRFDRQCLNRWPQSPSINNSSPHSIRPRVAHVYPPPAPQHHPRTRTACTSASELVDAIRKLRPLQRSCEVLLRTQENA